MKTEILEGRVVHGEGRGARIGFPTLNIEGAFSGLEQGVYAVWVTLPAGRFKGAMNYGPQPTFAHSPEASSPVRVEVFLLDFEGDVYGEEATVEVVKKIREVRKFESVEDLKKQIGEDVKVVRNA